MAKTILTLEGQKHLYLSLAEVFQDATPESIASIIAKLGLDSVVDENGNIVPVYSLDITSSKPTYITKDYNITIKGEAYNYFAKVSDKVTSWQWERDSGNPTEDLAWKVNKNSQSLNLTQADFTNRIESQDIRFILRATIGSVEITDEIIFSKNQSFSKVQIKPNYGLFIEQSPNNIIFSSIVEGFTPQSYKWYVNGEFVGTANSYSLPYNMVPLKGSVIVKLEVNDAKNNIYTDEYAIPRLSNGNDGEPGVPGPTGADGSTTYTWIKYADGPNGEGMDEYPFKQDGSAKEYLGMAVNKTTPVESNNPADYIWTKYIGSDGIPGENGYMWIKYSMYANGRDTNGTVDMYDTPFIMQSPTDREDMIYMGIAYNKDTQQESNIPEDYMWARIKGEDGHTGYILELSNDNTSVSSANDGSFPNPTIAFANAKTTATLYYGNDPEPLSEYGIVLTASTGVTYSANTNNTEVQITGLTQDTGSILFTAHPKDINGNLDTAKTLSSATFSITKLKNTAVYEIIPSTTVIKVNKNYAGTSNPEVEPEVVLAKVVMNTGDTNSYVTVGRLTYRYIFENTLGTDEDGTEIGINTNLTISNAGDPLFLEFKYFHPTTNLLVDRERIPFVRDGLSPNYEETRYQKTGSFSIVPTVENTNPTPPGWTVNPPTVGAGEILWMIKSTKKAQDNSLVGTWSAPVNITGPAGPTGPQGPAGQGGDLFIAPMGLWDPAVQYKGSTTRVEAVKYQNSWYVTRIDAGSIPIGTAPTNTTYWNQAQENFDFIATGLFLASSAYIDNLGVRNLKTSDSDTRVEIKQATNSLEFFSGTSTHPNIRVGSSSYPNSPSGDGAVDNHASIRVVGYDGINIISEIDFSTSGSQITSSGIKFNGVPSGETTLYEGSGSLVVKRVSAGEAGGSNMRAAVVGILDQPLRNDSTGLYFGGYFDRLLVLSNFYKYITPGSTDNLTGHIVSTSNSSETINLPSLTVGATNRIQRIVILKTGTGTLVVNSASGNTFENGSSSLQIIDKSKTELYWDGTSWKFFIFNSQS